MKRRKTLHPLVWLRYFCYRIHNWMSKHKPYYPLRVRVWAYRRYGQGRMDADWNIIRFWQQNNPGFCLTPDRMPLPWWLGVSALGPFVGPWSRVANWFGRHTGGRSHGCEFKDPEYGALYVGPTARPFMNDLFEQFVANISPLEVGD